MRLWSISQTLKLIKRINKTVAMKHKKRLDSMGNQVEFLMQTSNFHRVIRVDGAWGGVVPQAGIQMSVFSEIRPFPSSETYKLDDDGKTLLPFIKNTGKSNPIAREIEATLLITPRVAKSIAEWLLDKVEQYESLVKEGLESDEILIDDSESN